jgi:hypothetical protein
MIRPCGLSAGRDLHGIRPVRIRHPDFPPDAWARRFECNPTAVWREARCIVHERRGRDRLRGPLTFEAKNVDVDAVLTEDQPMSWAVDTGREGPPWCRIDSYGRRIATERSAPQLRAQPSSVHGHRRKRDYDRSFIRRPRDPMDRAPHMRHSSRLALWLKIGAQIGHEYVTRWRDLLFTRWIGQASPVGRERRKRVVTVIPWRGDATSCAAIHRNQLNAAGLRRLIVECSVTGAAIHRLSGDQDNCENTGVTAPILRAGPPRGETT